MFSIRKVCLLAYSGHGYVVGEALKELGYASIYYAEKEEKASNPFGFTYAGFERSPSFSWQAFDAFALGIGDNRVRKILAERVRFHKQSLLTVTHPEASIAKDVKISEGTFVARGACINPLSKIGAAVIINTGAIVEHECQIGDLAHIAPGAVLAGNVKVGAGAFIGANAVVKQGITIGENAIVGAGAVVIKDVPGDTTVVGNPAK